MVSESEREILENYKVQTHVVGSSAAKKKEVKKQRHSLGNKRIL